MALLFIAVFVSCETPEIFEDDDNGLFVPQSDMTQSQIVELLEEALKNTNSSDEITYAFRDSSNRRRNSPYPQFDEPLIVDNFHSLNKQAQKILEVYNNHNDGITTFRYVNNFDVYNGYTYLEQNDVFYSSKLDDVYWSHLDFYIDTIVLNIDRYIWTINEKCFVGKFEVFISGYDDVVSEVLEIVLTKDLKINNFHSNIKMGNTYYERECSCTYIANPMMLQGYNISDFSPVPQYEVKIIWKDGTENIFYTYYDDELGTCIFHWSLIRRYFPNKAFRTFFYDADYTNQFGLQGIITENTTLYAL